MQILSSRNDDIERKCDIQKTAGGTKNIESYNLSGRMKQLKNFSDEIYDLDGNSGQII